MPETVPPRVEQLEDRLAPGDTVAGFLFSPSAPLSQGGRWAQVAGFGDPATLALVDTPARAGDPAGSLSAGVTLHSSDAAAPVTAATEYTGSGASSSPFTSDLLAPGLWLGDPLTASDPFTDVLRAQPPGRANDSGQPDSPGPAGGLNQAGDGASGGSPALSSAANSQDDGPSGLGSDTGDDELDFVNLGSPVEGGQRSSTGGRPRVVQDPEASVQTRRTPRPPRAGKPVRAPARAMWDGGGRDTNWSNPANWVRNRLPGLGTLVIFDGTSSKDSTIDVPIDIGGLRIESAYTGTITQAAGIAVTTGFYRQEGGTLTGSSGALEVKGSVALSGGTLQAPSGTFTVAGDWTKTGGAFASGTGTVTFVGSGNHALTPGSTDDGSDFHHLVVNKPRGSLRLSTRDIRVGGTLTIADGTFAAETVAVTAGGLTLTGGAFVGSSAVVDVENVTMTSGTVVATDSRFTVTGSWTRTEGTVKAEGSFLTFIGGAEQTVDLGSFAVVGTVAVDKSGGVLTFRSGFTAGTLSVTPGHTVRFQASERFTVTNLSLPGTADEPITLDSTELWTPWYLNVSPAGIQTVRFVNVRHSDAEAGAAIRATDSVTDNGHNINWDFGTLPVLEHATVASSDPTRVYLRFSEPLDPATATDPANYALSGGLKVTAASRARENQLVTLTASGNVTIDATTVTARSVIRSLVGRNLSEQTLVVTAGTVNGFPIEGRDLAAAAAPFEAARASAGPGPAVSVELSLSTDDISQSVILNGDQTFTLTVRVVGTDQPTEVGIGQDLVGPGGTSVARIGSGFAATVITSGGADNVATVRVTGFTTGSSLNDFVFTAFVGDVLLASKFSTVISLIFSPGCLYVVDQRPVTQTLQVAPSVEGLVIFTRTRAIHPGGASFTTLFAAPQLPPTDANGRASRVFNNHPLPVWAYFIHSNTVPTTIASDNAGDGRPTDTGVPPPPFPKGPPITDPPHGTHNTSYPCPTCRYSFSIGSVDPSSGEKKLDIQDLVIPGRGLDYEFRRVYRSFNDRGPLALHEFGENWTYSYADERLVKDGDNPDTALYVNFRDGQNANLFINSSPGRWVSGSQSVFVQLRKNLAGDLEIREESGLVRVYHGFTDPNVPQGRLKELRDRNDNRLTFHYERIDPDGTPGSDDEKFVLAFVIDTLGREIRYQYYAATNQTVNGRQVTIANPNLGALGRLARVRDFKGDLDFNGDAESEDFAFQANNRTLVYDYDTEGDLVRASLPAVGRDEANPSTPNGNDFLNGKTFRYQYTGGHRLTHIFYPNEVRDNVNFNPPEDQAAEVITYYTSGPFQNFVSSYTVGGANGNGVDSGGTISYAYTDLNPGRSMPGGVSADATILYRIPTLRVDATDRNGNGAVFVYGGGRTLLESRDLTRGFRAGEPAAFVMTYNYNKDQLLTRRTHPEGNIFEYTFNENSPDRFQQSNLIRTVQTPDPDRGGDQPKIEMVYVYEPIYNRPCLIIYARGADVGNNGFTAPIPDPATRLMPDPYDPSRMLNLRYARVEFFDYQESTERAAKAPSTRLDIDGSGGQVNQSPLIAVDPDVLTTEVWLVQELGLREDASGLAELRGRLNANLTRLGLGDLNGDGHEGLGDIDGDKIDEPTIAGNHIRTVWGSPVLLAGSNQHHLEQAIDPIDLIRADRTYSAGGTNERGSSDDPNDPGNVAIRARLQTIVQMYQYNPFGQMTKMISPEGNVTHFDYFPENDPDGDGIRTDDPDRNGKPNPLPGGRTLAKDPGGYLMRTVGDASRTYFDQDGKRANPLFSNNRTNPDVTDITTRFTYDDVGNVVTMTNGRGIRTDHFVNEHNEVVQVTRAADISGVAKANPADPLFKHPDGQQQLTEFRYLTRTFFDFNGNVVLTQVEDRGNTSLTDGNGLKFKEQGGKRIPIPIPIQALMTTPGLTKDDGGDPVGDEAFVDTLNLYDRINNRIETRAEVDGTRALQTRYRYDGNQNLVLTIYPEGNADSAVYDERDLLFQSTRGANSRPVRPDRSPVGHYALTDPIKVTDFDRPGGAGTEPSTMTYNYDQNMNLVEMVDAEDTDGDPSNNSVIAGFGDVTRLTFDGYDRRRTVTDPLGNQTIHFYDPDSNVVRVIQDGAPVNDVVGAKGNQTLAVTEYIHDELSRVVATHRVLFQTPYPKKKGPQREPALSDEPDMDALAAYLADTGKGLPADERDRADVPGASGITVIGRVTTLTEYDRESRITFTVQDDLDAYRTDYDGASRVIKTTDSVLGNGFDRVAGTFNRDKLRGNTVEMAYDDNNNLIERKETDVTTIKDVVDEVFRTTYIHDSLDRLQTTFDNLGQAEDYRYDSRNNLVARADAVGPVRKREFPRRGLNRTESVLINDFGNVTRTFYDGINRTLQTEAILTGLVAPAS